MADNWTLSPALITFLKDIWADPRVVEDMPPGTKCYPVIGWTLGGTLWKPGGPSETLPPRYGLGWVKQPQADGHIEIPDPAFGIIFFAPSDEDRNSGRRIVDFDGMDIVVR